MNPSPDAPVYNLKAVVRETGLKPDTIRAWERRYGLPEPRRTESGHRLYSLNDINMLKWLIARQNEGVSISRAVELWNRLVEVHIDPLEQGASAMAGINPPPLVSQPATTDNLAQLREAWLTACLNFDEQTAERVLAQAFALFTVEVVCIELLQRGLAAVGNGWYAAKFTVQQEHFASALATRRLEALLAATPAPTRPGRILVGCPPREVHEFAALLLTLLLRRRGWEVIFLGTDIPVANLVATTRAARPQLLVLVAQQLTTAATLWEMGQLLFNERLPLAFGGRIFVQLPELRTRIPGHYLGDSLENAAQAVENIMAMPRTQPSQAPVTAEYEETLHWFKVRLAYIEAHVWQHMAASDIEPQHLEQANFYFGGMIIAALRLGNLAFLRSQLQWASMLIESHYTLGQPILETYLAAYRLAVEEQLGEHGALISHWLREEGYGAG